MKATVLQLLELESGLFAIGEKELPIAVSLKINQAITALAPVMHSIRETAQPILTLEQLQQQEKLQELYQEEMEVQLPTIALSDLGEIKIRATVLRQLALILKEEEMTDEY